MEEHRNVRTPRCTRGLRRRDLHPRGLCANRFPCRSQSAAAAQRVVHKSLIHNSSHTHHTEHHTHRGLQTYA